MLIPFLSTGFINCFLSFLNPQFSPLHCIPHFSLYAFLFFSQKSHFLLFPLFLQTSVISPPTQRGHSMFLISHNANQALCGINIVKHPHVEIPLLAVPSSYLSGCFFFLLLLWTRKYLFLEDMPLACFSALSMSSLAYSSNPMTWFILSTQVTPKSELPALTLASFSHF